MTFLNFTFQDPSPLINYSPGEWVEGSPTNDSFAAKYSQESFKVTFTPGATAMLSFVGNSITVFGAKRANHGNYSVVLDNGPEFMCNGTGDQLFQFPLWSAQNLSNSEHNVVFTNLPIDSNIKFLDIDFISVGREIGPPGYDGPIFNVTIDDESPFVVYNGSWSSSFSDTAFNFSLHSTIEEDASMSLFFQGSSIELYGLYVNAPFQAKLDGELPRNLAGPNVNLEDTMFEHPQTLLFYADGLDENQTHIVTLTNLVGDPLEARPFFFDFAIIRGSQSFFGDTPSSNPHFTSPSSRIPTPAAASASTNSSVASPSRSIPVGTIVGGAVGGVGGIIIIALIGFILFRRWRIAHSPPLARRKTILELDSVAIRPESFVPVATPTFGLSSGYYQPTLDTSTVSDEFSHSSIDLDFYPSYDSAITTAKKTSGSGSHKHRL